MKFFSFIYGRGKIYLFYKERRDEHEIRNKMVTIISFFASLSSIVFAYLAFKRSEKQDCKNQGKTEGVIFSDVGYIKACVDRVEKNLNKVDDRYRSISERLAKLEESLLNVTKRVDEIYTP